MSDGDAGAAVCPSHVHRSNTPLVVTDASVAFFMSKVTDMQAPKWIKIQKDFN